MDYSRRTETIQANSFLIDALAASLADIDFNSFGLSDDGKAFGLCFAGRTADLTLVWGKLRSLGYEPTYRPRKRDTSYGSYWRLPAHCHGHSDTELDCGECMKALNEAENGLRIWLYFESKSCKLVKVGTRTVEQPVYETQCESDLAEFIADYDEQVIP